MLTQQGLAEISDATQSEQIAYLLVERARLLDELEETHSNNNDNNNSNTNTPATEGKTPDTELKQMLEQVSPLLVVSQLVNSENFMPSQL